MSPRSLKIKATSCPFLARFCVHFKNVINSTQRQHSFCIYTRREHVTHIFDPGASVLFAYPLGMIFNFPTYAVDPTMMNFNEFYNEIYAAQKKLSLCHTLFSSILYLIYAPRFADVREREANTSTYRASSSSSPLRNFWEYRDRTTEVLETCSPYEYPILDCVKNARSRRRR